MTQHKFTDNATISGASRRAQDGALICEAFAVRSGIQTYSGAEVGLVDRAVVRVWRPESEVRDPQSLRTFSHAPITMGHPAEGVTADNWAELAKGEVSTEATWDGNKIKLPLIVKDAEAIAAIEAGTRELSAGYICALEFADGVTPEGESYDAIQREIRINHLAIVPKGRAGSECRIGDDGAVEGGANRTTWGAAPITTSNKKETIMSDAPKTVVLGDSAVHVPAAEAPAIEKFKTDQAKLLTDERDAHKAEIDAKDADIAKKDAEIDDLKGKILDDAAIDARAAERAELFAVAKSIVKDVKTAGLSDAAIRKAVVTAKLGDAAIADKSDAYIEARFDVMAEDSGKGDPVTTVLRDGKAKPIMAEDYGQAEYEQSISDAWKHPIASKGVN